MANGLWDYYSKTVSGASNKNANQRKLSDMYNDKNWNRVETYSDWTTITYDKKWNILSDSSVKNNNISVNPINNASKAWNQYDYMADVSKDKNRAREMIGNLKQYAETNPQLFKNYDNFKKFFNYDWRSASQQYILDAAYKNYNKYWLNSNENAVADDASQLASDKWKEKVQIAMDWYNKRAANLKNVYDTMNPKYQKLIDRYDALYNKAFKELDDLKKLANEYYQHTKWMYDEQSAGEAAWVESRLSSQGLGYTAIWSATTWVGNQWATRYNNLMSNHLKTLMELQDKWATIQTTILNWMWDLTDKQAGIVRDYMTWLNNLWDAVEKEQQDAVDWIYAPYEAITWQKVAWTAEKAKTQAEKVAWLANYDAATEQEKVQILLDYLWVDENTELYWDYYNALSQIAQKYPNNRPAAKSAADALYNKLNQKKTSWWTPKPDTKEDKEDKEYKEDTNEETTNTENNDFDIDDIIKQFNNWTWWVVL